jgi:hypothetical protein
VLETIIGLAVGGLLILFLLYTRVRRAIRQERLAHHDGWDEMMIKRLRSQGYHPFNEYRIDFFLGLPDLASCEAVRVQLEPEGFLLDVKSIAEQSDLPYSLHASKLMQLIVPDIQALSRRMSALAEQYHGRYDHWAA